MIGAITSWFRARTPREQLLLHVAVFIVVIGGGLTWGYQTASAYRADAAAELASATQLRDDVARLAALIAAPAAVTPSDIPPAPAIGEWRGEIDQTTAQGSRGPPFCVHH